MNWLEFLHMGGHAFYVWTAWGVSLTLISIIFILAKRRNARIRARLLTNLLRKEKFSS